MMMAGHTFLLSMVALAFLTLAQQGPPAWLDQQMAEQVADGGRWEADNSKYRSADEPFATYVVQWTWGPGRRSITGQLFALRDGKETPAFWTYRQFWDPVTRTVRLQQLGADGTSADGALEQVRAGVYRLEQTFTAPGGRQWRERHEEESTPNRRTTSSTRNTSGAWAPGRTYVWVRRAVAQPPEAFAAIDQQRVSTAR